MVPRGLDRSSAAAATQLQQAMRKHDAHHAPKLAPTVETPAPSDDDQLLAAWCGGDLKAGDELVRRHYRRLCSFIYPRVGGVRDEMVEVAHNVLTTVAQNKAEIRCFRRYLYGVARLKLYEHRRIRTPEPITEAAVEDVSEALAPTFLERMREATIREDVAARALRSLSADDQIILLLRSAHGLKLREVAEMLGLSPSQAAHRIAAARGRLRAAVKVIEKQVLASDARPRRLSSWMESLNGRMDELRSA